MAQNHYNVLDNGVQPWLPQPRGHARISHDHRRPKEQYGFEAKQGIKSSAFAEMSSPVTADRETRSWQRNQRSRNQSNWAAVEPGMQAIFLGPKRKSCGTGVFIPRGQGIDLQLSDKPAFSPVLLPCRVIQALNLNVHELGQHIKPHSEESKKEVENENLEKQKQKQKQKEDDTPSLSPEIFLPKEWTY